MSLRPGRVGHFDGCEGEGFGVEGGKESVVSVNEEEMKERGRQIGARRET